MFGGYSVEILVIVNFCLRECQGCGCYAAHCVTPSPGKVFPETAEAASFGESPLGGQHTYCELGLCESKDTPTAHVDCAAIMQDH